jgi:hypothetical protein
MPRRLYALEAKAARLNLAPQRKPQHFTSLADGISIGYRRNQNAPGTWVLKRADGTGGYWTKALGPADDYEAADGSNVLDFRQAQLKALELGRNPNGGTAENTGRPATVAEAVDAYELDLVARGGNPENARRLRRLVPGAILDKAVATLTVAELKRFRDGLAAGGRARSGVNRDMKPLRAALTLDDRAGRPARGARRPQHGPNRRRGAGRGRRRLRRGSGVRPPRRAPRRHRGQDQPSLPPRGRRPPSRSGDDAELAQGPGQEDLPLPGPHHRQARRRPPQGLRRPAGA